MENTTGALLAEWQAKAVELGAQRSGRIRCAVLILSGDPARLTLENGLSHEWISFADGLLGDVLGAEASRLKSSFGWHNLGYQRSPQLSGPFIKYFGDYQETDLDHWLDTQDTLNRLLTREPDIAQAVAFQGTYEWILSAFALACSSEPVSLDVQRRWFDSEGDRLAGDPLGEEGFRRFLQGELALRAGYHLCVLSGDVRRASQSAIQCFLAQAGVTAGDADGPPSDSNLSDIPDELIRRAGRVYLEHLLETKTADYIEPEVSQAERLIDALVRQTLGQVPNGAEVVEHPEIVELEQWCARKTIDGVFDDWWHQRVYLAIESGLSFSPELPQIASLLDQIFVGTANYFNPLDRRPPATQQDIVEYLRDLHCISEEAALAMPLARIRSILEQDVEAQQTSRDGRSGARHSPEFRSVNWFGTTYTFTETQADCVKVLWENWENRTPDVRQLTVLEKTDSDSQRLSSVFRERNKTTGKMKPHPAWGTMIVSISRGTYRLQEPDGAKNDVDERAQKEDSF